MQHLMKTLVPLGSESVSSLEVAASDCTESLRETIAAVAKDWNNQCENSQFLSILEDEVRLARLVSTSLLGQATSTGCTSAGTSTEIANAHKRSKSDTSDSESNGSGSSEEEDIGKEISFYIYQNRKGIPSKHFIKERVNWRNSYQLQLKLRKVVDGRATIVYDATSMVKKLETGMDQTIQTLKAQLANKAEEAKAAGILKKDKLKRSKTSRDNSGGYWRGNYIRRH